MSVHPKHILLHPLGLDQMEGDISKNQLKALKVIMNVIQLGRHPQKGVCSLTVLHGLCLKLCSRASSLSLPPNSPCSTFLSFMEFAVMMQLSPISLHSMVVVAAHKTLWVLQSEPISWQLTFQRVFLLLSSPLIFTLQRCKSTDAKNAYLRPGYLYLL